MEGELLTPSSTSSDSTVTVTPSDPAPRSRRMGFQFTNPAPSYHGKRTLSTPPRSPVGVSLSVSDFDEDDFEPCTPPELPVTPTSPTTSVTSAPGTPPVPPPRSPLRSAPRSVSSFTTLLASYQNRDDNDHDSNRDTMSTYRAATVPHYERMMASTSRAARNRSGSIASLSALLDAYTLNMGTSAHASSNSSVLASGALSAALTPLRTSDSSAYSRDGAYPFPDDKPLPNPPSDDSSIPTPTSLGHDTDLLSSASSALSGPPPGGGSQTGLVVSKRTHAMHELLSSERAYASDLAFVKDVHIPLALGKPSTFNPATLLGAALPGSSGSSARTLSTHSGSSTGSTQASSVMLSSSMSSGSVASVATGGALNLGPPMTKDDVRIIFGNIEELAMFADGFSDQLEEALGDVLDGGRGEDYVGKLFLDTIHCMEPLYKTYITRQQQASAHLTSLPKTPALLAYFEQTQKLATSVTHAWDLSSLLIKPVQRLLKYPLILATIIEHTPDCHYDKENLKLAREKMEEVARNVNEGRRRIEIVKEVLSKQGDALSGTPLKKKVSMSKSASTSVGLSLGRMKSMGMGLRVTRSGVEEESNAEIAKVESLERKLKASETFIRDLAKDVKAWATCVRQTVVHLREWSINFGQVIGLSDDTPSEAFDAFLDLIDYQLGPLCEALDEMVTKNFLPQLGKLLDSAKAPTRLLTAMRQLEPFHFALLNLNLAKSRPPQAMIETSQNYLALRGQLATELPTYLSYLDRGIVICIHQLAHRQTEFWSSVRDQWGGLWECLRIEGETNAGCEETLRLWWSRYSEMEDAVSKLQILKRDKAFPKTTRSQSSGPGSNLVSPYPGSQFSTSPPFTPPAPTTRHRSFGSMDAVVTQQSMRRTPSVESLPNRHVNFKSRPDTPESLGRPKTRSNTSPIISMASTSSPALNMYPSTSTQGSTHRDRDSESLHSGDRGRKSRSPSISRKIGDSLRAPLRRTPSDRSIRQGSPYASSSTQISNDYVPPVPNIVSHISPETAELYVVRAVWDYEAPIRASYLSLPFLIMHRGQLLDVLYEAGHPSQHDLPFAIQAGIDDGDECLLIARDERGDVGWIFASYVMPEFA